MSKAHSVSESFIKEAHSSACADWKKKIEAEFPDLFPKKITARIKSWEDILTISGKEEKDVLPYRNPKTKQEISQNAFAKIQLISEVLNEGWEPDFNNSSEYKWYPYFEKKSSGWGSASATSTARGGVGAVFYYKTEELALFAGKTFLDIYTEYLPK